MPTLRATTLATIVATTLSLSATAQSRNVQLLGRFNPGGGVNDVWGHRDPATGREFAILMNREGTYIVETTDPAAPVNRGFFSRTLSGWRSSTWRDARTYRGYAYVVTEGGGGMQIIDLRDPNAPRFVRTYQPPISWGDSHNIAIDTGAGVAYPCGTSGGTHVIDLSQDPENPTYVTSYTYQYVHDLHIQDGYAHLAEISRSTYRVVDVTQLPSLPRLGSVGISAAHNAWPTRDNGFAIVSSETTANVGVTVVDISNKSAPRTLATWSTGSGASAHNAYVQDRVVHIAYYSEGYRALDLSNPSTPLEVGYYDTNSATTGYSGDWGCYPFQPSGVVYASDRSNGLFVLKPRANTELYGAGTPGTGGVAPELHTFGAAFVGNGGFAVEVEAAPAGARVWVILGVSRVDRDVLGVRQLVDGVIGTLEGTTDSVGRLKLGVPVPNAPGLNGATLYVQAFVQDSGAGALGLSASQARAFEIFVR